MYKIDAAIIMCAIVVHVISIYMCLQRDPWLIGYWLWTQFAMVSAVAGFLWLMGVLYQRELQMGIYNFRMSCRCLVNFWRW